MSSLSALTMFFGLLLQANISMALEKLPDGQTKILNSQDGCQIIFYGPTEWQEPDANSLSWRQGKGTSRWICPESKSVTIEMPKAGALQIKGGTSMIKFDNQVYVINGEVLTKKGNALKNHILYSGKETGWSRTAPQPARSEVQNWILVFPTEPSKVEKEKAVSLPKEQVAPSPTAKMDASAKKTTTPAPISQNKGSRLMVSAYLGTSNILSEQSEFSAQGSSTKGIRGWLNLEGQPHSRIMTLDVMATENKNSTQDSGISNIESILIGWGPRYHHNNDLGCYALAQIGIMYNRLDKYYGSYSVKRDRMYIPIGTSIGLNYLLLPKTLRILTAIEFTAIYALNYVDQIRSDSGTLPADYKVKGNPFVYGINIHLGPAIQF